MTQSHFDSDDDFEMKQFAESVTFQIQENTNDRLQKLNQFLENPDFITKKGDPNTNIINRLRGKCYRIPQEKLGKFFRRLEACRRTKTKLMFAELQNKDSSALMLDFDILQTVPGSQVTSSTLESLASGVFGVLCKFLNLSAKFNEKRELDLHCIFTRKPQPVPKDNHYKDGLHMIVPSVKLSRPVKRFLIDKIVEFGVLEDVFGQFKLVGDAKEILDKNSAHVPVFFVGCSSKPDAPSYAMDSEYVCRVKSNMLHMILTPVSMADTREHAEFNVSLEYSLSFQGTLPRYHCELLAEYQEDTPPITRVEVQEPEAAENISALAIYDPNVKYVKGILDVLAKERATNYYDWFRVICTLANMNVLYRPLAEYFSLKCPEKYDPVSFEEHWAKACSAPNRGLRLGTLIWMAKEDNYEKWEALRNESLHNLIRSKIYNPLLEGNLGHYNIAELLFKCLSDKFVFEARGTHMVWYEFIHQSDPHRQGEVFKYRIWDTIPDTLRLYISQTLVRIFEEILPSLKGIENAAVDEELKKYHIKVRNNFKMTARNLMNSAFKNGVCQEARQLFSRPGFSDMLDKDPLLLGVGNGVLKLGTRIEFIARQHEHLISKYTSVNYKSFDPFDPTTKQVLLALRNMFPDDEADTHDFVMHYLASTLDNQIKDSIFLMIIGGGSNGKSFLMELHKATIGDIYSVKLPLEFFTKEARNSESAMPCMMQLQFARLAYLSESDKATKLVLRKIKELTGAESVYSRQLHESGINFKPRCHYIALSNNDFIVEGSDWGTWRRMMRIQMKNQFFGANDRNYDPSNPRHKLANKDMGKAWPENPAICSAYLGILCWYYQSYVGKYRGSLTNLKCDTIRRETEEYHNTQDRMNLFINSRAVKCADKRYLMDEIAIYQKWYEQQFGIKITNDNAQNDFLSSKLSKFIKQTREGYVLEGYRMLDVRETPDEDEEYYMQMDSQDDAASTIQRHIETPEQYYERICREWKAGCTMSPTTADKSVSPTTADKSVSPATADKSVSPATANEVPRRENFTPTSNLQPIHVAPEVARASLEEEQGFESDDSDF